MPLRVAPKAKWEKMRLVYSESYNRRKKEKTRFRTSRPFGERQGISEKMDVEVCKVSKDIDNKTGMGVS